MENSDLVNYTKVSHHFKFNCSPMKNQHLGEFVSSPVFRALGNEWVVDYYYPQPKCSCPESSRLYSITFLVRLHGKYLKGGVNPTFSLSIMRRDGTTYTLSHEHLKGGVAVQKGWVFAFCEYRSPISTFWTDVVKDGSFELICSIDNKDIPHNRCSLGVPKSFDWHSHFGKLFKSSETANVNSTTTPHVVAATGGFLAGSKTLEITDYSILKKVIKTGNYIQSDIFTVGGYQWVIKFYPQGLESSASDFISIGVRLINPTNNVQAISTHRFHDWNTSTWSTDTLVDTNVDTFSSSHTGWGYFRFIRRSDFETSSYLRNDTLVIKTTLCVAKDISS